MAKKKHKTPPDLDHLFSRHVITEDMYSDFWSEWWKTKPSGRQALLNFYMEEGEPEYIADTLKHPEPTQFREEAERQAKAIGGYVARRNSRGRFSKTGRTYQAIRRRKK